MDAPRVLGRRHSFTPARSAGGIGLRSSIRRRLSAARVAGAASRSARLAVEGGGQVKAELVSVGQSGEQSLKLIETAGERPSGGLKGLDRQAEAPAFALWAAR
jgi:hypothetical protein